MRIANLKTPLGDGLRHWLAISIILAASADIGYPNQGTQSWTILGFREILRGEK
jgi:hypothetical protein